MYPDVDSDWENLFYPIMMKGIVKLYLYYVKFLLIKKREEICLKTHIHLKNICNLEIKKS